MTKIQYCKAKYFSNPRDGDDLSTAGAQNTCIHHQFSDRILDLNREFSLFTGYRPVPVALTSDAPLRGRTSLACAFLGSGVRKSVEVDWFSRPL